MSKSLGDEVFAHKIVKSLRFKHKIKDISNILAKTVSGYKKPVNLAPKPFRRHGGAGKIHDLHAGFNLRSPEKNFPDTGELTNMLLVRIKKQQKG